MMERRLGIPCVGVAPMLPNLGLDEEDGVAIEDRRTPARAWANCSEHTLRIGVVALPHMANFTDFDALALEPSISLAFLEAPEEMAAADLLILPGTKQTLDDLRWLERGGFAQELRRLTETGVPIVGI
jgi:adenosylcobyric acid synthase